MPSLPSLQIARSHERARIETIIHKPRWEMETDPGVHGIDQFLADAGDLGRSIGT